MERLYKGGILAVAGERRVRGAVERTYVLAAGGTSLMPEDMATASPEDHLGYSTTFAVGLIAQFERYLRGPRIDPPATGPATAGWF
ncbi:MAG TPA: hypothetical protein VIA06_15740 [Candidatus Dormibacteraeota bacterium]|jgi:hypothetical protein|nr:hypothetical protein [Candidatus Dormibacteraeota bacterium]